MAIQVQSARRLEQIQRAYRVSIEIIKGDLGRAIMRRLRRGMNNHIRCSVFHQLKNTLSVADVTIEVFISCDLDASRCSDHEVSPSGPKNTAR